MAASHSFTFEVIKLGEDGSISYINHRPKKRLPNALLKTNSVFGKRHFEVVRGQFEI